MADGYCAMSVCEWRVVWRTNLASCATTTSRTLTPITWLVCSESRTYLVAPPNPKQKALFEIDSFTEKENSNETETLVTVANHEAKGL